MKRITCWIVLLLISISCRAQEAWLSDEQARQVAETTVQKVYPENCYSTYRQEFLEDWVFAFRREKLKGNRLNRSIYAYRVAFDSCETVGEENGHPVLMLHVVDHEANYGYVVVDRETSKAYWFQWKNDRRKLFNEFVIDMQLYVDAYPPLLAALYRELVWGAYEGNSVSSKLQLRHLVEDNFSSAFSPYEQDRKWERQFERWWKCFLASRLEPKETTEQVDEGTLVRGFSFTGFDLTIPRSDPPPKGSAKLMQWTVLVRKDGTVSERGAKTVFESR